MKRKLGEILIDLKAIDDTQLQAALEHQKRFKNKLKLGSSLVALGFLNEERLTQVLSRYLNIPMVDLSMEFIPPEVLDLVPIDIAERFQVMPFNLFEENRKKILGLAMADPTNLEPIDIIQFSTSLNIRPYVTAPSDIDRSIQKYYHGILVDGISYVGTRTPLQSGDKVKVISRGEEITWHGNLSDNLRGISTPDPNPRAPTEAQQQTKVMGEMLKILKEQNALMKVLVKKGIVSEEELNQEIDQKKVP